MMSIVRQNEKNEHKDGGQWTDTKASLGRPATGTVKLPRTVEMSFNSKQELLDYLSLVKTGALSIQVAYTLNSLPSLSLSHSVCMISLIRNKASEILEFPLIVTIRTNLIRVLISKRERTKNTARTFYTRKWKTCKLDGHHACCQWQSTKLGGGHGKYQGLVLQDLEVMTACQTKPDTYKTMIDREPKKQHDLARHGVSGWPCGVQHRRTPERAEGYRANRTLLGSAVSTTDRGGFCTCSSLIA